MSTAVGSAALTVFIGSGVIGTLSGGWRIVRTMGTRLTRLKPRSGFCAETGAAGAGSREAVLNEAKVGP